MPNYRSKSKYACADAILNSFQSDQERWFERGISCVGHLPDSKREQLCCLFGAGSSTNELLGSNGVERGELMPRLAMAIQDHLAVHDHQLASVTITNAAWRSAADKPAFDLVEIRLAATLLKKLADASIAIVRFGCLPDKDDASRFEFHARIDSLLFGPNVDHDVPIAAARLQKRYTAPAYASSPLMFSYPKVVNERVVTAAAATLLDMSDPFATTAKRILEARAGKKWSRRTSRRAFERFRLLSMCRLDRLMLATGAFESVLASLRAGAQTRVRKRYQNGDRVLHPDAIAHFWADPTLQIQSESVVLPFIKQRK